MKAVQVYGQPVSASLVERTLHRVCRSCKQKGLHKIEPGQTANTYLARGPAFKNSSVRIICAGANIAWEQRVRGELICLQLD